MQLSKCLTSPLLGSNIRIGIHCQYSSVMSARTSEQEINRVIKEINYNLSDISNAELKERPEAHFTFRDSQTVTASG